MRIMSSEKTKEVTSFAKIVFTDLFLQVRKHGTGIPKQSGFLHLTKNKGYCSSPRTENAYLLGQDEYEPIPELKLWYPTKKLTFQAIQETCEKERKSRLQKYYKNGFPHNYSFNNFLDEFHSLVREAEQLEQKNEKSSKSRNEWNFASVLGEIQRRGLATLVSRKMEVGLQETLVEVWSNANNLKEFEEIKYQATLHQTKNEAHKDIIWAVRRLKDFSVEETKATTNYYCDLKDRMVQEIRRKALNIINREQINIEFESRLEDNLQNIKDQIVLKVVDQKKLMHTELLKIYLSVLKLQQNKQIKIMEKQAQLKEEAKEEISLNYWKNLSLKETTKVEVIPAILQNKNQQLWQKAQKEVLMLARLRLENKNNKKND